ncbi:DEAD/DEAH box helicase [Bacillus alkalicellulosilyticus]|uniref:DEAD/DEAH box helicase n=1 Tax=Alkalihalobacterium alkalicellulosilyticum TaxID=1912214 RepID=UPI000997567D|nr:DEAD/DEAH box helicase [Bacillus alkalicellulosilyticus]
MIKFSANYCRSNTNFTITNLTDKVIEKSYIPTIQLIKYIFLRKVPIQPSIFLQEALIHITDIDDKEILLTKIMRIQLLVLSQIERGVISFDSYYWKYQVLDESSADCNYVQLALEDLILWITHVGKLHHIQFIPPAIIGEIIIHPNGFKDDFIHIDLNENGKRNHSLEDESIYEIQSDHEETIFCRETNPITYELDEKTHKQSMRFLLKNIFGYNDFLEGQLESLISILQGNNTLSWLPSGRGKTVIYQFVILLQPTSSLVVFPTKELMYDQAKKLSYILEPPIIIDHLNWYEQYLLDLNDLRKGKTTTLFVTAEVLQLDAFRSILSKMLFKTIVIDEIHSASEWSHDFRLSYAVIGKTIREYGSNPTIVGLTATASTRVLLDVKQKLEIEHEHIISVRNFMRKELSFHIIKTKQDQANDRLAKVLLKLKLANFLIEDKENRKTGLVFTLSEDENGRISLAKELAELLKMKTSYYSIDQSEEEQSLITTSTIQPSVTTQQAFINNETSVLVSPDVFGIGIDHSKITFTIHFGLPQSLEALYQQAGRAGRDNEEARCIVLYSHDYIALTDFEAIFGFETDTKKILEAAKSIKGDLSYHFTQLVNGIEDVETDARQLEAMYHDATPGGEAFIPFGETQKQQEWKLYQLACLGIVHTWTVDWQKKQFKVTYSYYSNHSIQVSLLAYIQTYDYTFSLNGRHSHNKEHQRLLDIYHSATYTFIEKMTLILMHWIYQTTIYHRKRLVATMKEYGDRFTDGKDFHQKLEVYFNRTEIQEKIEKIIGKKESVYKWYKLLFKQEDEQEPKRLMEQELQHLEMSVQRCMESYRNDIAINVTIGFIKLYFNQFDESDGQERFVAALHEIKKLRDQRTKIIESILFAGNLFLNRSQQERLAKTLITSGFDSIADCQAIYDYLEDEQSLNHLLRQVNEKLEEIGRGGYPWET